MRNKALATFVALQMLDLLSTLWVLHHQGGYEMNPVVRALFPWLGAAAGCFLVKAGACLVGTRLHGRRLYAATGVYGVVVVWNLLVIVVQVLQ